MQKAKKVLLTALSMVLVAALAVTGTVAYLTSQDSDVNVMTLGNVEIEQIEEQWNEDGSALEAFEDEKPLYPYVGQLGWTDGKDDEYRTFSMNNVVDKYVSVKNIGKSEAYVRTIIAFEMGTMSETDFEKYVGYSFNSANGQEFSFAGTWTWDEGFVLEEADGNRYYVLVATHETPVQPGEQTIPSLLQVYLSKEAGNEQVEQLDGNGDGLYNILAVSQAVQTNGFTDAVTALNAGFGDPEDDSGEDYANGQPILFAAKWLRMAVEQDSPDTWDGTADTSWYNDTDKEFYIMTSEQLAGVADLVDGGNTFEGKTLRLGRDLDLKLEDGNGELVSFDPIGYGYDTVFKGTFDGRDHTISNLYQNGWALGYDYSTEGGGLFASVVDATIKDLTIDNAEIVMECIDMGILVGYSYGNCTYENITVSNSTIANYQRYTGGVVGEVNGTQTFKNVDVKDTVVSSLWGDFDCSLGGIIGGKYGEATITMEDCDVAAELNTYNDVTSSYQWYAYRRAGMLIGNSEETQTVGGRTSASASYLTAKNCTVTYNDWANYTYCEFAGTSWPYVRVQAGYSCDGYSNPRYGHPTDANGNTVVDDTHVHNDGETHNQLLVFDQLYGGGQGVYGTPTHDGVTITYNNK